MSRMALEPYGVKHPRLGAHAGGNNAPKRTGSNGSHRFVLVPLCVLA